MKDSELPQDSNRIAVVGLAGRFPGARSVAEFWRNLCEGRESISFFTPEELVEAGVEPELMDRPGYVPAKGFLEDADRFDAAFFGYTPREAELMDPQHRVFLECAWEALENAGYRADAFPGRIGVFAGATMSSYLVNLHSHRDLLMQQGGLQVQIANDKDYVPTRTSYKLGLSGPSLNVQTACSTSLVAVHLACQSLLGYESDMVLAGAVSISVPLRSGYVYFPEGVHSSDGHCRAFDAAAEGTLDGDGVGIVVLKRLEDAIEDGDHVHGVILGSAINNDGAAKIGYTAPSEEGQALVIGEALAVAGVEPSNIGYVEAHGTGTSLGDPIEVGALRRVFGSAGMAPGSCLLGSVKTNVGHLGVAAGMAGLIKALKAVDEGRVPPTLHFESPNRRLGLEQSPFRVTSEPAEWNGTDGARRAGVSSFGIGGTNAHVVLEQPPARTRAEPSARVWHLVPLSARTEAALDQLTTSMARHLEAHPDLDLADVAFTLQTGRRPFELRRAVVSGSTGDAVRLLEGPEAPGVITARCRTEGRPVAFLFPGGGAQYPRMGEELRKREPVFGRELDRCLDLLEPHLGADLRELLFSSAPEAREQLETTVPALAALFSVEYAMARTLMSLGLDPEVLLGHSLGEYIAACVANVMSLEDALALVVTRARLIDRLNDGAMLSIALPPDQVEPLLGGRVALGAINTPSLCVVSGPSDEIGALTGVLEDRGAEYRRLHIRSISHSPEIAPIAGEFRDFLGTLELRPPERRILSNVTGDWLSPDQATDPEYWVEHLRSTVRFADGMETLLEEPALALVEVGPGRTLTTLAQSSGLRSSQLAVPTMPHPLESTSSDQFFLTALGRLWCEGAKVDLAALQRDEGRRRLALPTYPFQRERFWVDRTPVWTPRTPGTKLHKRADVGTWFYVPTWRESPPARWRKAVPAAAPILAFVGDGPFDRALVEGHRARGREVVTVVAGSGFAATPDRIRIDSRDPQDYERLVETVFAGERPPGAVVHLWPTARSGEGPWNPEALDTDLDRGFYSLLWLVRALARRSIFDPLRLQVVSERMHQVDGDELVRPSWATLLGPVRVIHQEYPHIDCRSVDVVVPAEGSREERSLIDDLVRELELPATDPVVAYRRGRRWLRELAPLELDAGDGGMLREGGVYLITGGLGRVGSVLAEFLAREYRARLVLTTRRDLGGPDGWRDLAAREGPDPEGDPALEETLARLEALATEGAEIAVVTADVTDLDAMERAVTVVRERHGALHGVFHAAAIVGMEAVRPILEMEAEAATRQFGPKVYGASVLDRALEGLDLDFCLMTSSLAAFLGGLGYFAYSAANAYADAFAHWRAGRGGVPWISVNSDLWQIGERAIAEHTTLSELPMSPEEGTEAIRRSLSLLPAPQVAISTGDLNARVDQWTNLSAEPGRPREDAGSPQRPSAGAAAGAPAGGEPEGEVEAVVASIWQDLLGVETIGRNNSFVDLGGHSLLAVRFISALRDAFGVEYPLRALFEAPTVSGTAERLIALGERSGVDVPAIAELMAEIGRIPEEEVARHLDRAGRDGGAA